MNKKRTIAMGILAASALSLSIAAACSDHTHTYSTEWTYDSTQHWHEATCEHTSEQGDLNNHTFNAGVVTEATCTEAGYTTYTCTVCGYSYTANYTQVTSAATGHEYEATFTWDATGETPTVTAITLTCKHDSTHVVTASATELESVTIAADEEKSTAATCTTAGTVVYTASYTYDGVTYTGDYETTGAAATGHDYEAVFTWSADNTVTAVSLVCKNDPNEVIEVEDLTNVIVSAGTSTATCEEAGTITYTATLVYDSTTYTGTNVVDVPAIGHEYTANFNWNTDGSLASITLTCTHTDCTESIATTVTEDLEKYVAATCEDDGTRVFTATYTIGEQTFTDTYTASVAATGHNYSNIVEFEWTEEEDGTWTAVAYRTCLNDETHRLEHECVVESVDTTTCTEDGTITYTATTIWGRVTYTSTKVVEQEAYGHSYTTTWCVDENDMATHWHECTVCGDIEEGEKHTTCDTTTVAATFTSEGYTVYTCTTENCDYTYTVYTDTLELNANGENTVSLGIQYSYSYYYVDSSITDILEYKYENGAVYYLNAAGSWVTSDQLVEGTDYYYKSSRSGTNYSDYYYFTFTATANGVYTFSITSNSYGYVLITDEDYDRYYLGYGVTDENENSVYSLSFELVKGGTLDIMLFLTEDSSVTYTAATYEYTFTIAYADEAIEGETAEKAIAVEEYTLTDDVYSRDLETGESLYFSLTAESSTKVVLTVSEGVDLYVSGSKVELTDYTYTLTVTSTATVIYLTNSGSEAVTAKLAIAQYVAAISDTTLSATLAASDLTGDGAYLKFAPSADGVYTLAIDSTTYANVSVYDEYGYLLFGYDSTEGATSVYSYDVTVSTSTLFVVTYKGTLSNDLSITFTVTVVPYGTESNPEPISWSYDEDYNIITEVYTGTSTSLESEASYYYTFSQLSYLYRQGYDYKIVVAADGSSSLTDVTVTVDGSAVTIGTDGTFTTSFGAYYGSTEVIITNTGDSTTAYTLTVTLTNGDDSGDSGETGDGSYVEIGLGEEQTIEGGVMYTFTVPADGVYTFTILGESDDVMLYLNDTYWYDDSWDIYGGAGEYYDITLTKGDVMYIECYYSYADCTLSITTDAVILEIGDNEITVTDDDLYTWNSGIDYTYTATVSGVYTFSLAEDESGYVTINGVAITAGEELSLVLAEGEEITILLSTYYELAGTYTLTIGYEELTLTSLGGATFVSTVDSYTYFDGYGYSRGSWYETTSYEGAVYVLTVSEDEAGEYTLSMSCNEDNVAVYAEIYQVTDTIPTAGAGAAYYTYGEDTYLVTCASLDNGNAIDYLNLEAGTYVIMISSMDYSTYDAVDVTAEFTIADYVENASAD